MKPNADADDTCDGIGIQMKTAMAHLLLFLSLSSLASAADVPVYPGATLSPELTHAMQDRNPDSIVYTTPDDFDKVLAFYRRIGPETPSSTLLTKDVKHAGFRFPGKTFGAVISWRQRSAVPGTMITLSNANR
jgi:hypothetical protein